jgi:hypothetical protein
MLTLSRTFSSFFDKYHYPEQILNKNNYKKKTFNFFFFKELLKGDVTPKR